MDNDLYIKLKCVIISVLKQWKLIVMIMFIVGMTTDVVRTVIYTPQYESKVTVTIETSENVYEDLEGTRDYITTLDYILNGQMVKKYVAKDIGEKEVEYKCNVVSGSDSNIITMSVVSPSQKNSYMALNSIIKWYRNNTERLNFQYKLYVMDRPKISEDPIAKNYHIVNLAIGMVIGAILVCGFLAFVEFIRETVKSPRDIKRYVDARLYGKIPYEVKKRRERLFGKKKKEASLITSVKTSFTFIEAIKKLRNRIEESAKHNGYKIFMITSAMENEGKSSIAVNVAIALAENKKKVLIVDGDIRKPAIHKILEIDNDISINDYLDSSKSQAEVIRYLKRYKFDVVTARQERESAEQLFSTDKLGAFLEKAAKEYDFVIVDSGPAHFVNETITLNEHVDATLLMVKQNVATIGAINETIDRLVSIKDNVIGCIYNAGNMSLINTGRLIGGYGHYGSYGGYKHYGGFDKYGNYGHYGHYGNYDHYGNYSGYGNYDGYGNYGGYGNYDNHNKHNHAENKEEIENKEESRWSE